MKLIAIILTLSLFISCTSSSIEDPIINNDENHEISNEILVIDTFYPENTESNVQTMSEDERREYVKNLLPLGTSYKTDNFTFTTDMSIDFTRNWAKYINSAYIELSKILEPVLNDKISIYIFRNQTRYKDYAKILAPENVNSRGYYDPKFRLIVSYYDENPEKLMRTLLHECTHVILRNYIGHNCIPPWIDEGLACTYETGNFVNGKWEFGLPRLNFIRYLKSLLRQNKFNPFQAIMSVGWRKFIEGNKRNIATNYILSWSLVYFFIYYKNGVNKKLFTTILHKIRETREPEMKYPVLYDSYIMPNEKEFLRNWQEFLYSLN